jgi:hypothetical protein
LSAIANSCCNSNLATALTSTVCLPFSSGVIWHARVSRWRAAIKHNGKKIFLGNFVDEAEAGQAFDRAALKLRGLHARINFPRDTYGTVEELVAQVWQKQHTAGQMSLVCGLWQG